MGERVQQTDLAGRVTYTFNAAGRNVSNRALRRTGLYVGAGAGLSRYSLRPLEGYGGVQRAFLNPFLSAAEIGNPEGTIPDFRVSTGPIAGWAPNMQLYVGTTIQIVPWLPLVDVDFRYVQLMPRGARLGTLRFGTGFRYLF